MVFLFRSPIPALAVALAAALSYPTPGVGAAPDLAQGRRLYSAACAPCHGVNGNGYGPAARALDPRPRDFTSGTYKFRSTPSGKLPTDSDLFRTVARGVPRTTMPAWETLLSEQEILDVVAYIKTFSEKFERFGSGTPIGIPDEPTMTPATIAEGKSLYMVMQCWTCHGTAGRGDGANAGALTDEWGEEIRPFDFTTGVFKGGSDNHSVYRTIATGLNGTPMPAYGDAMLFGTVSDRVMAKFSEVYTDAEIEALKSYLEAQPNREVIRALSKEDAAALAGQRIWSLVHYVKSLTRESGLVHRLFVDDPELVK